MSIWICPKAANGRKTAQATAIARNAANLSFTIPPCFFMVISPLFMRERAGTRQRQRVPSAAPSLRDRILIGLDVIMLLQALKHLPCIDVVVRVDIDDLDAPLGSV